MTSTRDTSDADEAILAAAEALAARGQALSVAAVAAEAGVARGTVYRRFGGRQALVDALAAQGRALPPSDARERILDALGAVLRRQGLAATTLEEVAREAGVGVVTVYRRFGDRRGLLRAYVAERSPRRLAARLPLDGSGDAEAGLVLLATESIRFLREHREIFLLGLSPDPEAAALLAEAREGGPSVREITARFVDAHFPDPSGRTVHAFEGLMMSLAWRSAGTAEEDARFLVDFFLRGVSR